MNYEKFLRSIRLFPWPLMLFVSWHAHAQGSFLNLDFESATVPVAQPSSPPGVPTVDIAVALPGWSGFIGTNQVSLVMYNSQTLDTSSIGVFRSDHPAQWDYLHVLEGSLTVFMMGGYTGPIPGPNIPADTAISQTGLVPADARSIQFKTSTRLVFQQA